MYIYSTFKTFIQRSSLRPNCTDTMGNYLVKVVVDASSIDALGEEFLHGIPWNLVGWQVGAALQKKRTKMLILGFIFTILCLSVDYYIYMSLQRGITLKNHHVVCREPEGRNFISLYIE